MKIGAQLYTLRDFCKTTADFAETLARVAEIGYRSVQVSGCCDYDPAWLRDELRKNGLTCDLTHSSFDRLRSDPAAVVNDHLTFGCRYIGIGGYNGLREKKDVDTVVEVAKWIAPTLAAAGCRFSYHNHFTELIRNAEGVTRLLEIASRTEPEELAITLDSYWLQYGGADIADYIVALKGRIPCVHFKDYQVVGNEVRMAAVGDGNLNFEKLAALCADSGTEYLFVEQDNCYGESPFDCLSRSLRYLRSLGLSE